jgi:hypothetical protein
MKSILTLAIIYIGLVLPPLACSEEKKAAKDGLSEYQVEVEPAAIFAGGIVGLANTAITTIHTAKDIAAFWNPLSSKENKDGRGISINPYRLDIFHSSAKSYVEGNYLNRMLANMTVGYAENPLEIAGVKYMRDAYSVDTYFYVKPEEDPVKRWFDEFTNCPEKIAVENAKDDYRLSGGKDQSKFDEFAKEYEKAGNACIAKGVAKTKWNDGRIAISYGQGQIWKDVPSSKKFDLGKRLVVTGLLGLGEDAGIYVTYQYIKDAVDTSALATSTKYNSNNLVAARYVYGTGDATLRYLVEVSNAKTDKGGVQGSVYKNAIGVDKLVAPGVWAQLRYGSSTTASQDATEKKALLNFTFAYACMLNKCKSTAN